MAYRPCPAARMEGGTAYVRSRGEPCSYYSILTVYIPAK